MIRKIFFKDGGWAEIHHRDTGWIVAHGGDEQPASYSLDTTITEVTQAETADRPIETIKDE